MVHTEMALLEKLRRSSYANCLASYSVRISGIGWSVAARVASPVSKQWVVVADSCCNPWKRRDQQTEVLPPETLGIALLFRFLFKTAIKAYETNVIPDMETKSFACERCTWEYTSPEPTSIDTVLLKWRSVIATSRLLLFEFKLTTSGNHYRN